jgi:hypothetical protein
MALIHASCIDRAQPIGNLVDGAQPIGYLIGGAQQIGSIPGPTCLPLLSYDSCLFFYTVHTHAHDKQNLKVVSSEN